MLAETTKDGCTVIRTQALPRRAPRRATLGEKLQQMARAFLTNTRRTVVSPKRRT